MRMVTKARVLVTRFPFSSRFGGEELHTLTLMKALDSKGIEGAFLGSCPVLLKEFKNRGFDAQYSSFLKPPVSKASLFLFTLLSPILFFKSGILLRLAKRRWKVDTVYMHSLGEKLLMTPWAKLFGLKVFWVEHARIGNWLRKNPWLPLYKLWSRWVTTVVTSHAMKTMIEPFAQNVLAIPCSVLVEPPQPLPEEVETFLKGGFSVGAVARFSEDKGVDMIAKLVHGKPEIRLIFVGEGPLENTIRRVVPPHQLMILPSLSRGQLSTLYRRLDLFILASKEMDPFGMVAAEAMWQGCPVVLTSVCGFAAELENEQEALVVEPKFVELDKALKRLMKNGALREGIASRGKAFVQKNHRFEEMVEQFEDLFLGKNP